MAVSQEALTILLPLYVLDSGASAAFAAMIAGLRGVGVLLFDVPAGMLVARFGDKPVLLGGLSLILVSLVLLASSQNPWLLGRRQRARVAAHAHGAPAARAVVRSAGRTRRHDDRRR